MLHRAGETAGVELGFTHQPTHPITERLNERGVNLNGKSLKETAEHFCNLTSCAV